MPRKYVSSLRRPQFKKYRPSRKTPMRGETKAKITSVSVSATRAGGVSDLQPVVGTGSDDLIGNKYYLTGMTAHLNAVNASSNHDYVRLCIAVIKEAGVTTGDADKIMNDNTTALAPFSVYDVDAFGDFQVLGDILVTNNGAYSSITPTLQGEGFAFPGGSGAEGDFIRLHWKGNIEVNKAKHSVVLIAQSEQSASQAAITGYVQLRFKDM